MLDSEKWMQTDSDFFLRYADIFIDCATDEHGYSGDEAIELFKAFCSFRAHRPSLYVDRHAELWASAEI